MDGTHIFLLYWIIWQRIFASMAGTHSAALDGIIILVGKVFENLQTLWETLLQPLIEWVIENIMPVIGPILQGVGDLFLNLLAVAGDVISGITKVLGGFIDFCTGAFSGDFSKCFQGLNEILDGFKQIASSVFKFLQDNVFKPLDDLLKMYLQQTGQNILESWEAC